MSRPEAVEPVIHAGVLVKGGEVFVPDLGEALRIDDLARLMLRLNRLEVKREERADGYMAIAYARPRFGESFCEELRVGAKTAETEHPLMQRSEEPSLSPDELVIEHKVLEAAMRMRVIESIQYVLMGMVEGHKAKTQGSQVEEVLHAVRASPSRTLH